MVATLASGTRRSGLSGSTRVKYSGPPLPRGPVVSISGHGVPPTSSVRPSMLVDKGRRPASLRSSAAFAESKGLTWRAYRHDPRSALSLNPWTSRVPVSRPRRLRTAQYTVLEAARNSLATTPLSHAARHHVVHQMIHSGRAWSKTVQRTRARFRRSMLRWSMSATAKCHSSPAMGTATRAQLSHTGINGSPR